jgi:hypothetical protein
MATYKDFLTEEAPPWLRQLAGEQYLRGLADPLDWLVDRHKDGVQARFPTFASPTGLAEIGEERKLERGVTDTDATYSARLKGAWEVWPWAGTAYGVLSALYDAGYTTAHLLQATGRDYSLNGSRQLVEAISGPFNLGAPGWSVFRVIFVQPLPAAWISGGIPASSSNEANGIRRLVNRWKAGHMTCSGYTILSSGRLWDYPLGFTYDQLTTAGLTWADAVTTTWTP